MYQDAIHHQQIHHQSYNVADVDSRRAIEQPYVTHNKLARAKMDQVVND